MRLRHVCLLCLACLGCHTLGSLPRGGRQPNESAERLWQEGEVALQNGRTEQAIDRDEQSLATQGRGTQNHLSLAAAHLELGDLSAASQHLQRYLEHHPEQAIVRSQFAELLMRLGCATEARSEFRRFLEQAAERNGVEMRRRVHAHGRLMQLAEQEDDPYGARLHRGIGLYLLACGRAELAEPEGELPVEGLLCKAAGELSLARDLEPEEARPCWYLYLVWHQLGQQHLAERWLQFAAEGAPSSGLTAAELRSLQLARGHQGWRQMPR
jgi:tetratricopeptide (TPR) repeat protein